jgi:hypothetical protein
MDCEKSDLGNSSSAEIRPVPSQAEGDEKTVEEALKIHEEKQKAEHEAEESLKR